MGDERHRLVVLGSAKVGKTNLIRRYLYNEFSEKYKETIEDLHSRQFRIKGVPLLLDILDTNFNFPDMRKVSIAAANAFLLVFAVDDVPSFKEMSDIWQEICARRPDLATLPVVVVGNKCDLPSKKIFEDTAKAFTSRLSGDVRYLEVSAKTNLRVTEIFRTLLELSGFPHNNDDKGPLEDTDELRKSKNREWVASSPLLRVKSARTRSTSREGVRHHSRLENNGKIPTMDKQKTCPSLAIRKTDFDSLKRNRSLRVKPSKHDKEKDQLERRLSDEDRKLSRSASLIRSTKRLSLKMRGYGEKTSTNHKVIDESDCKIQ
ncbi:hypothetical protein Angca_009279 [Angiostrongylus cantonensis]|nr:hypothetical protein Angca_009279 [Angiostrongylus cantonensis]